MIYARPNREFSRYDGSNTRSSKGWQERRASSLCSHGKYTYIHTVFIDSGLAYNYAPLPFSPSQHGHQRQLATLDYVHAASHANLYKLRCALAGEFSTKCFLYYI